MSRYHQTGRDHWAQPGMPLDEFERQRRFGKVQPMHEPTWGERLADWLKRRA